jgi:phosphohistidine phosphatase SixA
MTTVLFAAVMSADQLAHVHDCDVQDGQVIKRINENWNKGDLVLLIRHTEKCSAVKDACSSGDKGLTTRGVLQARSIHAGISSLGSAPVEVIYSPALRTAMTAKIALDEEMTAGKWLVTDCDTNFLGKIQLQKEAGVNLILVTHSHCLNAMKNKLGGSLLRFNAGKDDFFGMSVFLEAKGNQNLKQLGCLLPSNWSVIDPKRASI